MDVSSFFILWRDIGLFLYAILKAFLPLPSLEVVLLPLCMTSPKRWIQYSLEGAAGTFIGGAIGYVIAYRLGRGVLRHMASEKDIENGERLMDRYGMLAVFIGGVTPIPDFLLAYLAGFTHMSFLKFTVTDAVARLLRSLLVTWVIKELGTRMNVDRYGTIFSLGILAIIMLRWGIAKVKSRSAL